MEIWKDVEGYEGIYKVSNTGIVKSIDHKVHHSDGKVRVQKGRFLKLEKGHKGYLRVSLSKNGKRFNTGVHRLVAIAFILNPKNKPQVNHKDGIKDNNHVSNLEWCTNSENQIHAIKNNLSKHNYGEKHHNSKLSNKQVISIRSKISKGVTLTELSNEYGLTTAALSQIKQNRTYVNIN